MSDLYRVVRERRGRSREKAVTVEDFMPYDAARLLIYALRPVYPSHEIYIRYIPHEEVMAELAHATPSERLAASPSRRPARARKNS